MDTFKVGDIVSWSGAIGEITNTNDGLLEVEFSVGAGKVSYYFMDDGRMFLSQTDACLKFVRRKARKIKKTMYCAVRPYEGSSSNPVFTTPLHYERSHVLCDFGMEAVKGDVVATVTFEVDE